MIDETKIMQYADGTLPEEEKETVKKAIEKDPQLQKLLKDYQETGEILFNLGKEIKSQPLPSSLKDKLKTINEEKSKDTKKPFIFFRIPKVQYAAVATALILGVFIFRGFDRGEILLVDEDYNLPNLMVYKESDITKFSDSFDSTSGSQASIEIDHAMLELDKFKKSYDDHIDYHKYEKEKSEEFSKNKITNKLKDFGKAAFRGGDAVSIYKEWHASVFYINNASKIRYDESGKLSMGSMGTGSLVDRSGLIITNYHVAGEAKQVWVHPFSKGLKLLETDKFIGRIIAEDPITDLALIQVTGIPQRIKPVSLGIVQNLIPGQKVFAIGHPHGQWIWSITDGIINQIRPDYEYPIGDQVYKATLIQNNAAISGGNSGGPLFTEDGKMIGVNTWSDDDVGAQNLNFAIGVNHVKKLIQNRDKSEVEVTRTIDPLTEKKLREQVAILGTYDDNSNGKVDGWAADKNNNGIMDAIYVDENEDKIIEIIYTDANENKSWDSILFDVDQDGQPNYRYIDREDQNDDMKWDAIEFDTNQDGKWDVIQEIPKS